jgi:hypothetical protein
LRFSGLAALAAFVAWPHLPAAKEDISHRECAEALVATYSLIETIEQAYGNALDVLFQDSHEASLARQEMMQSIEDHLASHLDDIDAAAVAIRKYCEGLK